MTEAKRNIKVSRTTEMLLSRSITFCWPRLAVTVRTETRSDPKISVSESFNG